MAAGLQTTDWQLLAFALMSTHVHLVLVAGQTAPSSLFQTAHSPFGRWLNQRQGERAGHLFAGRYKLWAVRHSTAELLAYVHNNPVRAGVVAAAGHSTWTSHRFYVGLSGKPAWLAVERGLDLAGIADGPKFDEFVCGLASKPREPIWRGDTEARVLAATRRAGGAAIELSDPVITDGTAYGCLLRPRGFALIAGGYSPEQIIGAVEAVVGLPRLVFTGPSKTRWAARARRLALRVWRHMKGPQVEMSAALGISPSAACGLLNSSAPHHRPEDEERVRLELLRRYPQEI